MTFYIGGLILNKVEICGINTSLLPKATAKECAELIKKMRAGDKAAKEKLILANMRLTLSIVKRFNSTASNVDDLFQAGCVGLIKAAENFDESYNVKFSTYAVPLILGEIKRVLRGRTGLRVARSVRDTAYRALQARAELEKTEETVTNEEIAKKLCVAEKEVAYALDAISDTVSIYDSVYNKSGDTVMLLDQIADERFTDEGLTESVALRRAIEMLDERERKILYLRYYEGKTQTEISSEIGLSQAQVSRLEKNALKEVKAKIS